MSDQDNSYTLEEQDLNRTRQVRSDIITEMTKEGLKVDDNERLKLLLTVLTDTDRSALSRMKIKSEDKNGAANASTAAVIANFLAKVDVNNARLAQPYSGEAPSLPDSVPAPVVLPGETEVGVRNTDFDAFSKEHFRQSE